MLSIHLKRWCNKNNLTDTVLCLKRQYLLNICKLKRQTTTVRYSVAIMGDLYFMQLSARWQVLPGLEDTSGFPEQVSHACVYKQ